MRGIGLWKLFVIFVILCLAYSCGLQPRVRKVSSSDSYLKHYQKIGYLVEKSLSSECKLSISQRFGIDLNTLREKGLYNILEMNKPMKKYVLFTLTKDYGETLLTNFYLTPHIQNQVENFQIHANASVLFNLHNSKIKTSIPQREDWTDLIKGKVGEKEISYFTDFHDRLTKDKKSTITQESIFFNFFSKFDQVINLLVEKNTLLHFDIGSFRNFYEYESEEFEYLHDKEFTKLFNKVIEQKLIYKLNETNSLGIFEYNFLLNRNQKISLYNPSKVKLSAISMDPDTKKEVYKCVRSGIYEGQELVIQLLFGESSKLYYPFNLFLTFATESEWNNFVSLSNYSSDQKLIIFNMNTRGAFKLGKNIEYLDRVYKKFILRILKNYPEHKIFVTYPDPSDFLEIDDQEKWNNVFPKIINVVGDLGKNYNVKFLPNKNWPIIYRVIKDADMVFSMDSGFLHVVNTILGPHRVYNFSLENSLGGGFGRWEHPAQLSKNRLFVIKGEFARTHPSLKNLEEDPFEFNIDNFFYKIKKLQSNKKE